LDIVRNFPKIQLIQIKPEEFGYASSLNTAITKTNTDYICIISGHSLPISNTWLESAVVYLEKNSNIAAVTGHYTDLPDAPITKRIEGFFKKFSWKKQNSWKWLTNTNSLIRKSVWQDYNFDENLPECEDYDWALEVLSRGFDVILEPKFSVYHSHYHIQGAKNFEERKINWDIINKQIEEKSRPTNLLG